MKAICRVKDIEAHVEISDENRTAGDPLEYLKLIYL